jgi:hypothetical protein
MNRHDLEQKLPTMTQDQLVDTVKTCLDMIERLEEDLKAGAVKGTVADFMTPFCYTGARRALR